MTERKRADQLVVGDIVLVENGDTRVRARVWKVRGGDMWELLPDYEPRTPPRQPCCVIYVEYERQIRHPETGWLQPGTAFHVEPDHPVRLASKKG